ncbi:MAG: hypothetical protein DHS20C17_14450 [Cyclobacteriaceae bacterium]|nr:MAG: hypothetical protein DHS20C17_14450 [Cyclobacteriaceae bacterium]
MSWSEVVFRIREALQHKYEQLFHIGKTPKISGYTIEPSILQIEEFPYKKEENLKIFDRQFEYHSGINWHLDISSNKIFPKKYSRNIKLKNIELGDVKYTWEINRMLFLPNICLKYRHTGRRELLDKFVESTESWIKENPYLIGVNWFRNIEVSIRLINWALCWEIIDVQRETTNNPEFKKFVFDKWLPAIYLHCKFSYKNPSLFSSANNHLVSEVASLFIATSIWKFPESSKWNQYSKAMLEREIDNQHSQNGVNLEEASGYIQFTADFFLLSLIFANKTNNLFSEQYKDTLQKSLHYIFHMIDMKGNHLNYGDSDDGRAFMIESEPEFNNFSSLLTSGAIIFKDSILKSKCAGFDSKNQILFGQEGRLTFESIHSSSGPGTTKFYPDEGHFLFRKESGPSNEILLHFDAAPLGYLSIAAHGHADALSLILHVDGCPVLVDPGTYTYRSGRQWRKYFIGTLAHNTIRIDETDQAKSVGPTLWISHYQVLVNEYWISDDIDYVEAQHNGYDRHKVKHTRRVTFHKNQDLFKVRDRIEVFDKREHLVEIPWHLGPGIQVEQNKTSFLLKSGNLRQVVLSVPDNDLNYELTKGSEKPILGWYSSGFQVKTPSNVLYSRFKISENTTLEHTIQIKPYSVS